MAVLIIYPSWRRVFEQVTPQREVLCGLYIHVFFHYLQEKINTLKCFFRIKVNSLYNFLGVLSMEFELRVSGCPKSQF